MFLGRRRARTRRRKQVLKDVEVVAQPDTHIVHLKQDILTREQAGCLLWDFSASTSFAVQLIEHSMLDVIVMVLQQSLPQQQEDDARMVELCLGICANLCSVDQAAHKATATPGLVDLVINQAYLTQDVPVLVECCRLLAAALACSVSTWLWRVSGMPGELPGLPSLAWRAVHRGASRAWHACARMHGVMYCANTVFQNNDVSDAAVIPVQAI